MADTKTVLFSQCDNKHESTVYLYAASLAAMRLFVGADRYRSTAPGLGTTALYNVQPSERVGALEEQNEEKGHL